MPARHRLAAVTVLDKSCARADALATALMVLGEERGRQLAAEHGVAAYFQVHQDGTLMVETTPEFDRLTLGPQR